PEGKRAAAPPKTHRGPLAKTVVLNSEPGDRFAALIVGYQPRTATETMLVENVAACRLRQMRSRGMEKAGLIHELRKQSRTPSDVARRDPSVACVSANQDGERLVHMNCYGTRKTANF